MFWPQNAAHTPVISGKGRGDWRGDDRFVYIGLPGYGDGLPQTGSFVEAAWFGKPWSILPKVAKGSPEHLADSWRWAYRDHLAKRLADPVFAGAVEALHGKTLVCWCKGKPARGEQAGQSKFCHGDMLAWFAEYIHHNLL